MNRKSDKCSSLTKLYSRFPTLVAQNGCCTKFRWLRKVGSFPLLVNFVCPNFPLSKDSKIIGDETTLFILKKCQEPLNNIIDESSTVEDLLFNLDKLLSKIALQNPDLNAVSLLSTSLPVSSQILSELQAVGWDNISNLSTDLSTVHLNYTNEDTSHNHDLQILFPPSYPNSPLIVSHQLPDSWKAPLTTSVLQVYSCWKEAVDVFTPCWKALHELDRLCWVLDPDAPGPCHLYRRLVVATSISLHLVVDPSSPNALPFIRFLGADQKISPLRNSLADNVDLWEEEDDLLTNLERVLGVELPSRTDSAKEDWSVECGICYSYKLGEQLPTISCEDNRCCQPFHETCLYEWLTKLPGCRTTLNMVLGECPYCSKPLQCCRPSE